MLILFCLLAFDVTLFRLEDRRNSGVSLETVTICRMAKNEESPCKGWRMTTPDGTRHRQPDRREVSDGTARNMCQWIARRLQTCTFLRFLSTRIDDLARLRTYHAEIAESVETFKSFK